MDRPIRTIFTAYNVAQLTAVVEGKFLATRSATKDAAIARFLKATERAGFDGRAVLTVHKDLDRAIEVIRELVKSHAGTRTALAKPTPAPSKAEARELAATALAARDNVALTVAAEVYAGHGPKRTAARKSARRDETPTTPAATPAASAAFAQKVATASLPKLDDEMPDFLVRRDTSEERTANEAAWAKAAERNRAMSPAPEPRKPAPVRKVKAAKAGPTLPTPDFVALSKKTGKTQIELRREAGVSGEPRPGSKAAIVRKLLLRKDGATAAEICEACGWTHVSVNYQALIAKVPTVTKVKAEGQPTRYVGSLGVAS